MRLEMVEGIYDSLLESGLDDNSEAFDDLMMALCEVCKWENPRAHDVIDWIEAHEVPGGRNFVVIYVDISAATRPGGRGVQDMIERALAAGVRGWARPSRAVDKGAGE